LIHTHIHNSQLTILTECAPPAQRTLAEEVLADDGVASFRRRKTASLEAASSARGKGSRKAAKAKKATRHAKRRGRV
jgi:hypothetical protein